MISKRLLILISLSFAGIIPAFAQMQDDNKMIKESDFVLIEGGNFLMGCTSDDNDCYPDEQPQHRVSISTFKIYKYEVSVAQYRLFCQKTNRQMPVTPPFGWQDENPIVNITWQDAMAYAKWAGCRLPTEAEWEYAARGGNQSKGFLYSGSNSYDEVGWSYENSGGKTHRVGQKRPNELGIYDMSGNVWEWCYDWYGSYLSHLQTDPTGSSSGTYRVYRGGSCYNDVQFVRVSSRYSNTPNYRNISIGFRLARSSN